MRPRFSLFDPASRGRPSCCYLALCACLAISFCVRPEPLLAKTVLSVAATARLVKDYNAFMNNRPPDQVTSFNSPYAARNVVSLVLMQKALVLGGMGDIEFDFHVIPNSERERTEVKRGRVVIGSQDFWENDFDETVFKSAPVIPEGSFEKGIYTLPQNTAMLAVKDAEELRRHPAVIVGTWHSDRAVLWGLGVKDVQVVYEFQAVPKFLTLGRAEYTLLEFASNPGMGVIEAGVTLVPVPGIKIVLPGSRCWMVSRKHPQGEQVFKALSTGLAVLQQNGTITRAYTESGVFQGRVKGWKVVNR